MMPLVTFLVVLAFLLAVLHIATGRAALGASVVLLALAMLLQLWPG